MKRIIILLLLLLPCLVHTQTSPDFELTDSDGNTFELYADYLDQDKVVFVEFMFIACPPCKTYLPYMKDLYEECGSGNGEVEFMQITVLGGDSNADMAEYKQEEEIDFLMIGADGGALEVSTEFSNGNYGSFTGTPTFATIDKNGKVTLIKMFGNAANWNPVLKDSINAAIGVPPPPPPPPPPSYSISGNVLTADGQLWEAIPNNPNIVISLSGDTSLLTTENPFIFENIPEGMDVQLTALVSQDNPLHGVTTFDIVVISQFILGISDLSLEQQIAADINCSGSITTFDIISLRQLILYITESLPCNSYLSVPSVFLNENSALVPNIPSTISINNLERNQINQNFNMIKIGDLNQ